MSEKLKICENCKHWTSNKYVLQGYSSEYKYCSIATEEDSDGFMDAICSGEGITGELITRKDFGCILFYNAR